MEEETLAVNLEIQAAWDVMAPQVAESRAYGEPDADVLLVAHGIVAASAKSALSELRRLGHNVRLFRPVTLRPFPEDQLRAAAKGVKRIIVAESAINQLARFVKDALYSHCDAPLTEYARPSIGITPGEIVRLVEKHAVRHA
jgi:2-oxoglutarate ferredoxin oxidoreductase subunit alpha